VTDKPRIALLYDVPDWAFHNVTRNVSRVANGFDFSQYSKVEWFHTPVAHEIAQKADVIVFLWRFDALAFLDSLDETSWARLLGPDRPKLVAIVYDHLYQDAASISEIGDPFLVCDIVCSSSERLQRIYDAAPHLPDIFSVLADGVDLTRFHPKNVRPAKCKPLSIGWVGNSNWGRDFGTDLKGRRTVFDVALSILKDRNLQFESLIADRAEIRIPFEDMPAFYSNLDVLVCTSAMEGTPNPVLEAMASGVAIVSTDVGIVPDVLGTLQSQFVLDERDPVAFANALQRLIDDNELHRSLCEENARHREQISWESRGPRWKEMVETAMDMPGNGDDRCSEALKRYQRVPWRNPKYNKMIGG